MANTPQLTRQDMLKRRAAQDPAALSARENTLMNKGVTSTPAVPTQKGIGSSVQPSAAIQKASNVRQRLAQGSQAFQQSQEKIRAARAAQTGVATERETPLTVREPVPMTIADQQMAHQQAKTSLNQFLQSRPQESSVEMLARLNREAGRPELIQSRDQTLKAITNTQNILDRLEKDINVRFEETGASAGFQRRQYAKEAAPLQQQLGQLGGTLQAQTQTLSAVEREIDDTIAAAKEDYKAEKERLKDLAAATGLTDAQKAQLQTQERALKRFESGVDSLRSFATKKGILTPAFAETVREAQSRINSGEDPDTVLADVSAAVSSNPVIQYELRKSLKSGSGSDGIKLSNDERQKLLLSSDVSESDKNAKSFDELSDAGKRAVMFTPLQISSAKRDLKNSISDIKKSFGDEIEQAGLDLNNMSTQDYRDLRDIVAETYPEMTKIQITKELAKNNIGINPNSVSTGVWAQHARDVKKGVQYAKNKLFNTAE